MAPNNQRAVHCHDNGDYISFSVYDSRPNQGNPTNQPGYLLVHDIFPAAGITGAQVGFAPRTLSSACAASESPRQD